jgi:hypothetical protein
VRTSQGNPTAKGQAEKWDAEGDHERKDRFAELNLGWRPIGSVTRGEGDQRDNSTGLLPIRFAGDDA